MKAGSGSLVVRVFISLVLVAGVFVPQAFPDWVVLYNYKCLLNFAPCDTMSVYCDNTSLTCTRCDGKEIALGACVHASGKSCLSGGSLDCGDMYTGICTLLGSCTNPVWYSHDCSVSTPCSRIP